MFAYRTPGVYLERPDTRPPAMVPLRTDIAGFVGIAARGPLHNPKKLESWTDFTAVFGGYIPQGYLAYAVEGFFANGGQTCWVVRVADPVRACSAGLDILGEEGRSVLRLIASSPGTWAQRLIVTVTRGGGARFSLALRLEDGGQEVWPRLSLDPRDPRDVQKVLNDPHTGSLLVRACDPYAPGGCPYMPSPLQALDRPVAHGRLDGGRDGLKTLEPHHFAGRGARPDDERLCEGEILLDEPWGLMALRSVDDVSIVAMPDIMPKPFVEVQGIERLRCHVVDNDKPPPPARKTETEFPPDFGDEQILELQKALVRHCEELKDRVAILDPRPNDITPAQVIAWREKFDTKYAAFYYPWLKAPDGLRLRGHLRPVPPSGHVAGVYARVDQQMGVHKPPANEVVEGIKDMLVPVDDIAHGDLNNKGVNVIRLYEGRGIRIAGSRTLSSDSAWLYINVRRLLIMIEEAIDEQSQWIVFEPSSPRLWDDLERVVRSFLNRLWQQGMLDGATAEEAYYVRCDAATNPPRETDRGCLVCEVGVLPPWPAEFVRVRLRVSEGGLEILEETGTQNG